MLNYHALTQGESESGSEFVDRAAGISGLQGHGCADRRLYSFDEVHPAGHDQYKNMSNWTRQILRLRT